MSGLRPGQSDGVPWMRPDRKRAASAHTDISPGACGIDAPLPSRRQHTSYTIASTDARCFEPTRFRSVCVSFFPSILLGPGLVMSCTTLSRLFINMRAASICARIDRSAAAAAELMSGLRPGQSDGVPWMRPDRKRAASAHTDISPGACGIDAPLPSRRQHTSRTIASTDARCFASTRFRFV